jgi:hypothetical protein
MLVYTPRFEECFIKPIYFDPDGDTILFRNTPTVAKFARYTFSAENVHPNLNMLFRPNYRQFFRQGLS